MDRGEETSLFSQAFAEDAITASQLGTQVDFSFLDYNTQNDYPEFKELSQVRRALIANEGVLLGRCFAHPSL